CAPPPRTNWPTVMPMGQAAISTEPDRSRPGFWRCPGRDKGQPKHYWQIDCMMVVFHRQGADLMSAHPAVTVTAKKPTGAAAKRRPEPAVASGVTVSDRAQA